jgi:Tfp pilus assembly protein PilF
LDESGEGETVALQYFERALAINPQYGAAAVQASKILHRQQRYGEEESCLTGILAHQSVQSQAREWRELMLSLAELWESRGAATQNATAMQWGLKLSDELLQRYPTATRARMVRGNVLYRAGQLGDAAVEYRAVLDAEPNRVGALNNLAAILQADETRVDEALELYEAAVALEDGRADKALLNSYGAVLCRFPNRLLEAQSWFEAALEVDPAFTQAADGLRWVNKRIN